MGIPKLLGSVRAALSDVRLSIDVRPCRDVGSSGRVLWHRSSRSHGPSEDHTHTYTQRPTQSSHSNLPHPRASPQRPPAGHKGRRDERMPLNNSHPTFHDGWRRRTWNPPGVLNHTRARTDRAPTRVFSPRRPDASARPNSSIKAPPAVIQSYVISAVADATIRRQQCDNQRGRLRPII